MKIKYVQLESDAFLTDIRNVGRWLVDDRELLSTICTFWNVPISRTKAG